MAPSRLTAGQMIKHARETAGLSRRQLSQSAGLSVSYVGKVESGEIGNLSFSAFARLVTQLGMNTREIATLVKMEAAKHDQHDH